jgi:hypothetical protein
MPVLFHIDLNRTNPTHPTATDFAIFERVEQDAELARMFFLWQHSIDSDLILELTQLVSRVDDWRRKSQYTEAIDVFTALIAHLDQVAATKPMIALHILIVLLMGVGASRIDHRVPCGRWDLQWRSGLLFCKFIATHSVMLLRDRGVRNRRTGRPARRRLRPAF